MLNNVGQDTRSSRHALFFAMFTSLYSAEEINRIDGVKRYMVHVEADEAMQ